jgi:hypothetical protein
MPARQAGSAANLDKLKLAPVPPPHQYTTEFLFNYTLTLPASDPPMPVGAVSSGQLFVLSEQGTRITGPKINGSVAAYGQDYMTVRRDGVAEHKVRSVILTDDGARITFCYEGRSDWGVEGHTMATKGEFPEVLRIKSAPYMETDHPDYLWVNRLQCVEIGELYRDKGWGSFDVWAIF